jgi:hypothetical protein
MPAAASKARGPPAIARNALASAINRIVVLGLFCGILILYIFDKAKGAPAILESGLQCTVSIAFWLRHWTWIVNSVRLKPAYRPGMVKPGGSLKEIVAVPVAMGVKVSVLWDVPGAILTEAEDRVPAPLLLLLSMTVSGTSPASGWIAWGIGVF